MNLLVTGGAGFIGSTLVERLLVEGHRVLSIDSFLDYYPKEIKLKNISSYITDKRVIFIEGDLLELELSHLLLENQIEAIFHLAAQAGVRSSWGRDFKIYVDCNVYATQKLLEAAVFAGVKKIVFSSSSSVYGEKSKFPMEEEDLPEPVSPYGVTKLAAEHLVNLYSKNYGLDAVSLRYFTVYGPRQRPDMAFYRFMKAIDKGYEIEVYGDGLQTRDYTYIDDIVEANVRSLYAPSGSHVLNIGGGSRVPLLHAIKTIGKILNIEPRIRHLPPQKGDVTHTFASTEKAWKTIGFKPSIALEEGLRRQALWMMENGLIRKRC